MDLQSHPYLLPMIFVGMWLVMSAFFSLLSGWWSLGGQFRANERPAGEKVTGQVKRMGMVPENGVTHIVVSQTGLYLYASFFFRFVHPALLIPWSSVGRPREIKGLWWSTYEYDLASINSIRVTQRAHEAIEKLRM